jgi:hypothetical protein
LHPAWGAIDGTPAKTGKTRSLAERSIVSADLSDLSLLAAAKNLTTWALAGQPACVLGIVASRVLDSDVFMDFANRIDGTAFIDPMMHSGQSNAANNTGSEVPATFATWRSSKSPRPVPGGENRLKRSANINTGGELIEMRPTFLRAQAKHGDTSTTTLDSAESRVVGQVEPSGATVEQQIMRDARAPGDVAR